MLVSAILSVVLRAVAVFAVTRLMPGIRCKDFKTALVVALGVSVLNFLVWKLLFILSLPFVFLTGFVGYFIITAAILWTVDQFVEDFEIKGLGTLVIASTLIAAINGLLSLVVFGHT